MKNKKPNETNTPLPMCILFYRDGVSESQYNEVIRTEISAVERAWARVKELFNPKEKRTPEITFLVAGKRHNVRFFPLDEAGTYVDPKGTKSKSGQKIPTGAVRGSKPALSDRLNGNLWPGLLVDDIVTHPDGNNFFLQSHAAIIGTARSAHYVILRDDMFRQDKRDELQSIVNNDLPSSSSSLAHNTDFNIRLTTSATHTNEPLRAYRPARRPISPIDSAIVAAAICGIWKNVIS